MILNKEIKNNKGSIFFVIDAGRGNMGEGRLGIRFAEIEGRYIGVMITNIIYSIIWLFVSSLFAGFIVNAFYPGTLNF